MFARRSVLAALLAAIALWPGGPALSLDQVRLGKAVPNSFAFGAAEVGIEAKIFDAEGRSRSRAFAVTLSSSRHSRRAASKAAWVSAPGSAFAARGGGRLGMLPGTGR